jgi:hypothetical protein
MKAEDIYEGMDSLGPQSRELLQIEIYLEPDMLKAYDAEVLKQKLGEEAWHQARGLIAAKAADH